MYWSHEPPFRRWFVNQADVPDTSTVTRWLARPHSGQCSATVAAHRTPNGSSWKDQPVDTFSIQENVALVGGEIRHGILHKSIVPSEARSSTMKETTGLMNSRAIMALRACWESHG